MKEPEIPEAFCTAAAFNEALAFLAEEKERAKILRYFKSGEGEYGAGDVFIGVKMGQVFELAKAFINMPVQQIELLMESHIHEARAGAMSIMDKQARSKKTSAEKKEAIYNLYLRRHDRVNNWDLVDLAAIHVIGGFLQNRDRQVLYRLAHSANMWERRTAIVATAFFIKSGDVKDTFAIAEILVNDTEDLVNKAVGGWIRHAGAKTHRPLLLDFLNRHAAVMPRTTLRYAIEHLDEEARQHYLGLKTKPDQQASII
ncbi:MAG: DNA alkylation repair protein [Bacteroidota bacterium]